MLNLTDAARNRLLDLLRMRDETTAYFTRTTAGSYALGLLDPAEVEEGDIVVPLDDDRLLVIDGEVRVDLTVDYEPDAFRFN